MISRELKPGSPPYGAKVRLKEDYQIPDSLGLGLQHGDRLVVDDNHQMTHIPEGPRRPRPIIPAGSIGVVEEGPYCSGIFNYEVECPVQFGIDDPMIAETQGIPWELLELVE